MGEYSEKYYCNNNKPEHNNLCPKNSLCLKDSLIKALELVLNFDYLDLTIDVPAQHYGLRFYTLFNRLDAVGGITPSLTYDDFISLQADISVPAGYNPAFDNTDRNTIIPVCALRAVAFVVEPRGVDILLRELKRLYRGTKIYNTDCSCNKDILDALVNCKCNPFNSTAIYEIGIDAIDRSFNPARGKIVAYDSQLVWVQSVEFGFPPTFYIVPLKYISFITIM